GHLRRACRTAGPSQGPGLPVDQFPWRRHVDRARRDEGRGGAAGEDGRGGDQTRQPIAPLETRDDGKREDPRGRPPPPRSHDEAFRSLPPRRVLVVVVRTASSKPPATIEPE